MSQQISTVSIRECCECTHGWAEAQLIPRPAPSSHLRERVSSFSPACVALSQLRLGFYLSLMNNRPEFMHLIAPTVGAADFRISVSPTSSTVLQTLRFWYSWICERGLLMCYCTSHSLTPFLIYHLFHNPLRSFLLGLLLNVGCGKSSCIFYARSCGYESVYV